MKAALYVFVILASFLVLFAVGQAWKLKPETKATRILHKGDRAVLTAPAGGPQVWLTLRHQDCYWVQTALAENDLARLRALAANHTAFPVPSGTRVRVVSESVSRRQVQILEGPSSGQTGWVEHEFLKPDPSPRS